MYENTKRKVRSYVLEREYCFKLQGESLKEVMALGGSKLFEPMEGRPMKGWVQIPFDYKDQWKKYATISVDGVKELERKPAKKKTK